MRRSVNRPAAFAVLAVLAMAGRAAADLAIDQSNTAAATAGYGIGNASNLNYSPVGQSFTPGLVGIDFATFNLSDGSRSTADTLDVSLYAGTGVGGALLGTSKDVTIPALFGATGSFGGSPVEFDFAARIALTPGTAYTLIVNLVSGNLTSTFAYVSGNTYSGGVAIISGNQATSSDAVFSEGIITPAITATPEPSTLTLAGAGAVAALGYARRRRRVRPALPDPAPRA